MRFSLRNQKKISDSLGEDYLIHLKASLGQYFLPHAEIEQHDIKVGEVNHKCIFVPSIRKNSKVEFQFLVISITYDVYNLAYYSSIG